MSRFLTPLLVAPDNDGRKAKLLGPLVYESDLLKRTIHVPEGFETDFASVPQLFWNIIPPVGSYARGAVIHDFLYRSDYFTRAEADQVLLEAMECTGVPWRERQTIYWAVRAFGWHAWRKDHQETTHPPK